jgi:hypothetical protein
LFLLSHCGDGELIDWALNPIPSCIASFTPRAPSSACRHVPPHVCPAFPALNSARVTATIATLLYGASVRHATNAIVVQCGVKADRVNPISSRPYYTPWSLLLFWASQVYSRSNWFRFLLVWISRTALDCTMHSQGLNFDLFFFCGDYTASENTPATRKLLVLLHFHSCLVSSSTENLPRHGNSRGFLRFPRLCGHSTKSWCSIP